ncbi:MAG: hypothetical protein JNN18_04130 [Rubrivivax sp.]|nr:hypothetical protein [Rubrivivax sp.]
MVSAKPSPHRLAPGLLAACALLAPAAALHAAPVQWTAASGGNDHWYEYVPAISIFEPVSQPTARAAALGSAHLGLPGYLATVTSAAEQLFIQSSFGFLVGFGATGTAWLGASDAAVEGQWRWLDGPEAGELVSYADWLPGQPVVGLGFEDYDNLALYINAAVAGAPPTFGWVSVSTSGGALGYVVEYGAAAPPPPPPGTAPAPASLATVLSGLALLGWSRRRGHGRA